MQDEAAEDRVSGRLQSVRRTNGYWTRFCLRSARNKWTIFFVAAVAAFFVSGNAQAGAGSGTISVQATVPQTVEFSLALAKNSSVTVERPVVFAGERVRGEARLLWADGRPLRHQEVSLSLARPGGEEISETSLKTGTDGVGSFELPVPSDALGSFLVWARVTSFSYPVLLGCAPVVRAIAPIDSRPEKPLQRSDEDEVAAGESEGDGGAGTAVVSCVAYHSGALGSATMISWVPGANARAGPT